MTTATHRRYRCVRRLLAPLLLAVVAATGLVAPARAADDPLTCGGDLTRGPTPVLLVPGTTQTPEVNFSWNYEKVFTEQGRGWCAVTLPE